MNIYEEAINKFGVQARLIKALEELSELNVELAKQLGGADRLQKIAEEWADVQITMECIMTAFELHKESDDWRNFKLDRLQRKISE